MLSIGTVSDFDIDGRFGVINADDGRVLLFNLRDTSEELCELFEVRTRAEFIEREFRFDSTCRGTGLDRSTRWALSDDIEEYAMYSGANTWALVLAAGEGTLIESS